MRPFVIEHRNYHWFVALATLAFLPCSAPCASTIAYQDSDYGQAVGTTLNGFSGVRPGNSSVAVTQAVVPDLPELINPPPPVRSSPVQAGNAPAPQWQAVPLVPKVVLGAGIRPGGEGGQWPQAICIDPVDGKFLLYGTDVGGIFRSLDGGKSFEPCNRGYTPRGNCGFAIDPVNINRALAIGANSLEMDCHSTDSAVVRSTDAGQTWQSMIRSVRVDNVKAGPDGGREAIAIRVHPKTRCAYVGTGCYGFWKFGPPAAKRAEP